MAGLLQMVREMANTRMFCLLLSHVMRSHLRSHLVKREDLLPAGIHYWKMGSTGATQRDGHNRGTNRLGRVKG